MLACLIAVLSEGEAEAIKVFQIGNSLTWDSQPEGIRSMADSQGLAWTGGYHIRSASSIKMIYENPTASSGLSEPGPTWVESLPGNDWDVLVVQPHNSVGNTMQHDVDYALLFREAAQSAGRNLDTRMYVYSTWPALSTNWSQWLTPVPNELSQSTVHQRQFFEHVATRLEDALGESVFVIPAGDVLYRLKQEIEAGNVPDLTTMSQVYRDNIHLGYSYGRFVAGTTVLATIGKTNPIGIAPAAQYSTDMNPATVARIQEIVWDVVANHPHSGAVTLPGDYDGSGTVDLADYNWWRGSFGTANSHAADGNGDGQINAADYTVWRDALGSGGGAGGSGAVVPEPGAVPGLMAIAAWTAVILLCKRTNSGGTLNNNPNLTNLIVVKHSSSRRDGSH